MTNIQTKNPNYSAYQPGQPGYVEEKNTCNKEETSKNYRYIPTEKAFFFGSFHQSSVNEETPEDTETAKIISKANYGAIL